MENPPYDCHFVSRARAESDVISREVFTITVLQDDFGLHPLVNEYSFESVAGPASYLKAETT